jgi:hypothetical protein
VVALSIIGAEYIVASNGGKDAAWIRQRMMELEETITPTIRINNEATDKLTKTNAFHCHIKYRFHYIMEEI